MLESDRTQSVDLDGSLGSAAGALAEGTVIGGRYVLHGLLGKGGYAYVYRAFDNQLRHDTALKILRPERIGPTPRARLRREAAVAREVESPHLVRIFDVALGEELNYLTMELVEGGTLSDVLREGPLAVGRCLEVLEQSLEGLAALHTSGIAHRDVKPGNILLTGSGVVKLADFGLALRWGSDETRATVGDAVVGTVDYLAPEQILGQDADEQSDLYSLGVVAFEMLTGDLPRRGASALGTMIGHLKSDAPDVRALRPEIPRFLAEIVSGLLERSRQQRYHSAAAVLADLRAGTLLGSRRVRARLWRLGSWLAIGLALLAAATAWAVSRLPHFSHLAAANSDGGKETIAVGRRGELLWHLPGVEAARGVVTAHLGPGEAERVVAVLRPRNTYDGTVTSVLSILDEETGAVIRTVRLPSASNSFDGFSNQFAPILHAVDLDGDGYDEIVATYVHNPYWPSYSVIYEPRLERSRVVFIASGHHFFAGAYDLDGDGAKELLFAGVNNRMGWYSGLAAVRLRPSINVPGEVNELTASTPDAAYAGVSHAALLWYALGPRGFVSVDEAATVDVAKKVIAMRFADGTSYALTFDGFPPATVAQPGPGDRRGAREEAYTHLQECMRLSSVSRFAASAADECAAAERAAERADDRYLAEWVARAHGKALVSAGRLSEAEAEFEVLMKTSSAPSEAAFDAARSLHLHGNLERAVAWYQRGLGPGALDGAGRGKYEFLEGQVLALGELGRWSEANEEIARFAAEYPIEIALARYYEQYVRWRQHSRPEPSADSRSAPDLQRYWDLEFRRENGEPAADLLVQVDFELKRASGETCLLHSLRGELLAAGGRRADALAEAREAFEQARAEVSSSTAVRAHLPIIAERYAKLAGAGAPPK